MPFVTTSQILGEIPAEWRDAALTDGETGATPEEVWDQLQASVEDDIAAALSPAYDLPAYDADATATPILRNVRSAARHLTLATLFRRRSTPEDQNPWAKLAADSIKSLRALGQRQDKGPAGPPRTTSGGIRVIGEPSRLTPSNASTPRRRRGAIAGELLILLAIGAAVFAAMVAAFRPVPAPAINHPLPTINLCPMSRTVTLKAAPLPVDPVAARAYRATPMVLTIQLDASRPTATGWDSLTAEIRTQQVDATAPLAAVSLAIPTGAGPFTLAFTGAQMNQDLAGAAEATFWLVIYASKDAGETLDVWHAGRLVLMESGASQVAAAPPNGVGPLSLAAADLRYEPLGGGLSYQPLDPDLTAITAAGTTTYGRSLLAASNDSALRSLAGLGSLATQSGLIANYATSAAVALGYQPLDPDLTAIAASSTEPFGRSLLGLENADELRNAAGLIPCPTYANDAAADADSAILSGTFYRTTAGGRAVFRKP